MNENFVENDSLTDEALVEKINAGQYELLQPLLTRYLPVVVRLAEKYAPQNNEVEDYVQDGSIALCNAVRDYRPGQASFSTFAHLCVTRAMVDLNRSAGRKRRIPQAMVSSLEDTPQVGSEKSAETVFLEKESLQSLTDHIKVELSGFEYRVLSAFLAGNSYAVIADAEQVSVKSVNNALTRIRKKLRQSNQNG